MSGSKRALKRDRGFILRYEVSGDLRLEDHRHELPGDGGVYEIAVHDSVIRIRGEKGATEIVLDVDSGILRVFDHQRKRHRAIESWSRAVDKSAHRLEPTGRRARLGNFAVRTATLMIGEWRCAVKTLDEPVVPGRIAAAIWNVLIPGVEAGGVGVPAALDLSTPDGEVSLKLLDVVPGCDPIDATPPAGYDVASREVRRSKTVGSDRIDPRRLKAKAGLASMAHQHALRSQGQDAAFVMDQGFLDALRATVNGVTSAFGVFYGDGDGGNEPMHIELDWWEQLRPRLDFGSEAATLDVLDGIRLLLVYLEVAQGNPLPPATGGEPGGLSVAEQATYDTVLADAEDSPLRDALGIEAARVLEFQNQFDGPRRLALGAQLMNRNNQKTEIVVGPSLMRFGLDFVNMEIWDFDTTIEINNQGIIDQLRFEDGRIRARLALERFHVDFQFNTLPDDSVGSILCNIFTLGACTTVQANYGYGYVSADDVEIVIDIVPQLSGGEVTFESTVDRDASSMDIDMLLIGVNPVADIVGLAASAIISWFAESVIEDRLYPSIEDEVPGLLTGGFLDWPSVWHAMNGPGLRATAALFSSGSGALEADVRGVSGLPGGIAAPVDAGEADPLAYAVTARYLTAWLRSLAPETGASTTLPLDGLLTALGVVLPDARSADTGESEGTGPTFDLDIDISGALSHFDGCDDPPAVPADEYRNVLELRRSRPVVTVPPSGPATRVGDIAVEYRLEIAARRARYRAVPRLVEEPCFEEPRFGGRGPEPDPLPPWVDRAVGGRFGVGRPIRAGRRALGGRRGAVVDPRSSLARLGRRMGGGDGRFGGSGPRSGDPSRPFPPEPDGGGFPFPPEPDGGGFPFPQPPDDDFAIPSIICPPPHCEWSIARREATLETYLSAVVTVTAAARMGFNDQFLSFWIPDLRLALVEDSAADLDVTISSLTTSGPLAGSDEADLRDAIASRCRSDAWALLGGLSDEPARDVQLVPGAAALVLAIDGLPAAAINEISDLFVYEQSTPGGLTYVSDGNLVYWSITYGENLSGHVT